MKEALQGACLTDIRISQQNAENLPSVCFSLLSYASGYILSSRKWSIWHMLGKWIYGHRQIGHWDSRKPLIDLWTHQKQDIWPQAAKQQHFLKEFSTMFYRTIYKHLRCLHNTTGLYRRSLKQKRNRLRENISDKNCKHREDCSKSTGTKYTWLNPTSQQTFRVSGKTISALSFSF